MIRYCPWNVYTLHIAFLVHMQWVITVLYHVLTEVPTLPLALFDLQKKMFYLYRDNPSHAEPSLIIPLQ